jgi:large subunit ribosomal protein L28
LPARSLPAKNNIWNECGLGKEKAENFSLLRLFLYGRMFLLCLKAIPLTVFDTQVRRCSDMASVCEICAKGELSGNNVSHSHLKTKRSWKPNIQRVRAVVEGEVKRVNVCTRCLRSGKVQRAL